MANELLCYVFEEEIHYRDKRELVYAYALKVGGSYEEAEAFLQLQTGEDEGEEQVLARTDIIRYEFQRQEIREDFITFMLSHQQVFYT